MYPGSLVKSKQFVAYAWGTLIRPRATFEKLLSDPAALAYGTMAVLAVGACYTISQFIGYLNGFGACTLPFLPISAKDYYYYQTFFTLPVFLLTTLVYAAVAQFLSAFFAGKGKFEECVAMAGFGLYVTIVPLMLVPETIMFIFSLHSPTLPLCGSLGIDPTLDLMRQVGAGVWQFVVTTIGLKTVQRFSWIRTLVIGLVSFSMYEAVFWAYIR